MSALGACATYDSITPPAPVSPVAVVPGTDTDCGAACANGRKLGCEFGKDTAAGATCEAVCHNSETSSYVTMNPRCMAMAASCDAADACSNQ